MEILSTFPKQTRSGKYDWQAWFDGQVRKLHAGTDFDATVTSMRNAATQRGKALGFRVRTHIEGDTLTIQAKPREEVKVEEASVVASETHTEPVAEQVQA